MSASPQAYREKLEDLEIYMQIILERYRNALVNYTVDVTNANNKERYRALKSQIELGYGRLFILQNSIEKSMEDNDNSIKLIDTEVGGIMINSEGKNSSLKEKRAADLAAIPQEQQMNQVSIERYIYLAYYSIATILGFVFLYKH
jgi:hypothetical protein